MSRPTDAPPVILALDLGTATGVVRGRPGDRPSLATWRLPASGGADVGAYAVAFSDHLAAALADRSDGGVGMVVFEAPFLGPKMATNMHTARRLLWAPGEVERQCAMAGVLCGEASMQEARKAFTGSGRADKADIVAAARRRGFDVADHHQADAAAVWFLIVAARFPAHAGVYDPLFVGVRA